MCVLHAGMMDTSAVTILFTPRLDRAPLTRPQVKARYYREKSHVMSRDVPVQSSVVQCVFAPGAVALFKH